MAKAYHAEENGAGMRNIWIALAGLTSIGLAGCASLPKPRGPDFGVAVFEKPAQLDAYVRAQNRELKRLRALDPDNDESEIIVTASKKTSVDITNTQEEGVDEGGIVKATGNHIIILRRGALYSVRYGDGSFETIDRVDAFAPGDQNPSDTWYDEMLLHDGVVVVIGYSDGEGATEVSRFGLSEDGQLSYRDTHFLPSEDYYSSSNYASRMVDGHLLTYTPTEFDEKWREQLPWLERRKPDGTRERVSGTLALDDIGISAEFLKRPHPSINVLHSITSCNVLSENLSCKTRAAIGNWSRNSYFSRDAAYIWSAGGDSWRFSADNDAPDVLYRLPLIDDRETKAVTVVGSPIDQFSFLEDREENKLHVVLRTDGLGDEMWGSEFDFGETSLLQLPLDLLGDGSRVADRSLYRGLPSHEDNTVTNRFVGRHLLYGSGFFDSRTNETPEFYVTPLDEPWVQRVELPHGISRIDQLGKDGVVIGPSPDDALSFSTVTLDKKTLSAKLTATQMLPATEESENRSHAFFFKPDPEDESGSNGIMALPVVVETSDDAPEYLSFTTAITYLQRVDSQLTQIGVLSALPDATVYAEVAAMEAIEEETGDCIASCTDWYGNTRPIFIGNRIFALMGDELVEGLIESGQMKELRRIRLGKAKFVTK